MLKYVGKLQSDTMIVGEDIPLYWIDSKQTFFDMLLFAGVGNIGHMIEQVITPYRSQIVIKQK
jgi:hypothetical protein